MDIKRLSDITTEIGFQLLTSGAEIHRVEDTICRIAAAYGARADVFAIPASLVVTIGDGEGHTFTQTRRVYHSDSNLARVDALNALARHICARCPEEAEILAELGKIRNLPRYSLRQQLAAAALGAGAFALLFGGGIPEAAAALVVGVAVRFVATVMERTDGGSTLSNILGGAACVLGAGLCSLVWRDLERDTVIISVLMLLVPGLLMTNSMRDLIAGDLVTGVMKSAEALLVATCVAIGVMCSLAVWRWLTMGVM